MKVLLATVGLALASSLAQASPNVSTDDPVYDRLAELRALGTITLPYEGGLRPLTRARVRELLGAEATDAEPDGFWIHPLERAWLQLDAIDDHARAYNTPLRPRREVGAISIACERQEGRPCGTGLGLVGELDASAGYRDSVSAVVRGRVVFGTDAYDPGVAVDRLYLNGASGPLAWEVGRDALQLGPSSRTQGGWGSNASTLDMVRVSTAHPLDLIGEHGDTLRLNIQYVLGRLRDPQTFSGNVVSITRAQADVSNRFEIGMFQMLQTLGDGAPSLSVWEFIKEHVHRKNFTATAADTSNRRIGFDFAAHVASAGGARFYYQMVFEDWRARFHEAIRFEADHIVGLDLAALGKTHRYRAIFEFQETGYRSHEHEPRVTGFTNAGHLVGSPLGPDARFFYAELRVPAGVATLAPWIEFGRMQADTYTAIEFGPLGRETEGPNEWRGRAGLRTRAPIRKDLRVDAEAFGEVVQGYAFDPDRRRWNGGLRASLTYTP